MLSIRGDAPTIPKPKQAPTLLTVSYGIDGRRMRRYRGKVAVRYRVTDVEGTFLFPIPDEWKVKSERRRLWRYIERALFDIVAEDLKRQKVANFELVPCGGKWKERQEEIR